MGYSADTFVADEIPTTAKWNKIWTNDASFNDGTGIGVSAITPEKLLTGTGTTWPWQTWTPSFANLTIGNGVLRCSYAQVGKVVAARIGIAFGSTSAMGNSPTFTLPVTASSNYISGQNMGGMRYVANANGYSGYVQYLTTTTAAFTASTVTGLGVGLTDLTITSTVPNTWGTAGTLYGTILYEAA